MKSWRLWLRQGSCAIRSAHRTALVAASLADGGLPNCWIEVYTFEGALCTRCFGIQRNNFIRHSPQVLDQLPLKVAGLLWQDVGPICQQSRVRHICNGTLGLQRKVRLHI